MSDNPYIPLELDPPSETERYAVLNLGSVLPSAEVVAGARTQLTRALEAEGCDITKELPPEYVREDDFTSWWMLKSLGRLRAG